MAEKKGLLVTCDRCDATTFRKYIGKGDADGGYTTWDKFESIEEGWEFCAIDFRKSIRLCPTCAQRWKHHVDMFLMETAR